MVHTGRRRGKARSRILYWFRTPPGVRVGRAALDEDAIRLLEQYNPDVEFDWTRMLKGQPEHQAPPQPQGKAEPPRRERAERRSERAANARPPQMPEAAVDPVPLPGAEGIPELEPEDIAPEVEVPPSAAHARLGAEGLLRLRARYAEVMARISERVADPAQQDELKSKAERLNPDAWVTDEEVRQALDAYEAIFDELRAVVGRPKKRRRRRRASGVPGVDRTGEAAGPGDGTAGSTGEVPGDAPQSLEESEDS